MKIKQQFWFVTSLIFLIVFSSCQEKIDYDLTKQNKIISGAYYVESVPEGESGNVYIFSDNELQHFVKRDNLYSFEATFNYYFKGKKIYTCLPYVNKCDYGKYDLHYEIISIDTVHDEQIVKLKSTPYELTLRKTIKYHYIR